VSDYIDPSTIPKPVLERRRKLVSDVKAEFGDGGLVPPPFRRVNHLVDPDVKVVHYIDPSSIPEEVLQRRRKLLVDERGGRVPAIYAIYSDSGTVTQGRSPLTFE
jgi:hypothetical protein